jgi:hypothetical protein
MWQIYASDGPCMRWVGSLEGPIDGTEIRRLETQSEGWADLSTTGYAGSCDMVEQIVKHVGGRYRVHSSRRCRCVFVDGAEYGKPRGIASAMLPPEGCTPWALNRDEPDTEE